MYQDITAFRTGSWDELHLVRAQASDDEIEGFIAIAVLELNGERTARLVEAYEGTHRREYPSRDVSNSTAETCVGVVPPHLFENRDEYVEIRVADVGLDWPIWWTDSLRRPSDVIEWNGDDSEDEPSVSKI